MGVEDGGDLGLSQGGGGFLNCQPSGKQVGGANMSSMVGLKEAPPSMATPPPLAHLAGQFIQSNWNPFVPMDRYVDFDGSTAPSSYNALVQENQGMSSSSDACPMEQITRLPFLNGGKIRGPLGFSEDGQTAGPLLPTGFLPVNGHGVGKDSRGKKRRMAECGAFDTRSSFDRIQAAEAEHEKDVSPESFKCPGEKDEKGERGAQIPPENAHKPTSNQAKENSSSGDAPKEDYIHVRAKRGQATNSHSLAERVRREKISQRMKFLQDLVPGCSKITGKAVMLDEIINYVQSLQHQVEFLSMKLATVNPELNFDNQQFLSIDPPHLQTRSSAVPRFGPGFGAPQFDFQGPIQRVMQEDMSSNAWDDELQNVVQVDFIPSTHINSNTKSPGSMKMEQ